MLMDKEDLEVLDRLTKEYSAEDILSALEQAISIRADELIDHGFNDRAKEYSRVAWHLHIYHSTQ